MKTRNKIYMLSELQKGDVFCKTNNKSKSAIVVKIWAENVEVQFKNVRHTEMMKKDTPIIYLRKEL